MIIFLLVNKDLGVEDKELGKENAINVGGGETVNNESASKCFRVNPDNGTERAANSSSSNMDWSAGDKTCDKEHSENLTYSEAGESEEVSGDHDNESPETDILVKTAGQTDEVKVTQLNTTI